MDFKSHYRDILKKAELLNYIAGLIESWNEANAPLSSEGPSPDDHVSDLLSRASDGQDPPGGPSQNWYLMPQVFVVEGRVLCNGKSLDLRNRPRMLRLFEAFCKAPGQQLSREEAVVSIYDLAPSTPRSSRFTECMHQNGVKLISRARCLAQKYLNDPNDKGIQWFVYDQEQKLWSLYRLTNEYINEKFN